MADLIGPPINDLIKGTAGPAILEARSWLQKYDGRKGSPIDLSQAAPPYPPPQEILHFISDAAALTETAKYGPVPGDWIVRSAYADHCSKTYDTHIDPEQISITAGCNQAFFIASLLVARRGESVILPAPWYFNHKMTLDMLGIESRLLACSPSDNFEPDASAAERLIDERVRAIVLVTPNNPTGATYSPGTIEAFATMCRKKGIWLILDETYRDFRPLNLQKPHALFDAETRANVIALYSFSKSLAIPGYRLGAMIYPPRIAEQVTKVQDCLQICAARVGQIAVAEALSSTEVEAWRWRKRKEFADKSDAFRSAMIQADGWAVDSIGAFFAYLRHPHDGVDGIEVAKRLARENGLLLIPGSYFGPNQERYLRLSFGNLSSQMLQELPSRFVLST